MVTMGTVWDRTTEVLGGRLGMLAAIAALALFFPSVISDAWTAYAVPATHVTALVGAILALAALIATIWGQLAILAIATDPATTRGDARRQASTRLLPALAVTAILSIVAIILASPIAIALAVSGYDVTAAMNPDSAQQMSPGTGLFVFLYSLLLFAVLLWAGARLTVLNPVVLNERVGLGAIRRSIALTRGYSWKLIGVILLFVIVILISAGAAQLITGVVFRLILGEGATAPFLAQVAVQAVTTGFTVVAAVFTAQLYLALHPTVRGPIAASE